MKREQPTRNSLATFPVTEESLLFHGCFHLFERIMKLLPSADMESVNFQTGTAYAIFCTIAETTYSTIVLYQAKAFFSALTFLRTVSDNFVDLLLVTEDENYVRNIEARTLVQRIQLAQTLINLYGPNYKETENSCSASTIINKNRIKLNEHLAKYDITKEDLKALARFKKADRLELFLFTYQKGCSYVHGDFIALDDRHTVTQDGKYAFACFKEMNRLHKFTILRFILEMFMEGIIVLNELFKWSLPIEPLQKEFEIMRLILIKAAGECSEQSF
jgi:hypothetical protein